MVARLVTGILALVLGALGLAFLAVGLLAGDDDAAAFTALGAVLAVSGAALAAIAVALRRRGLAARERRRDGGRATAEVVAARFRPGVRIGAWLTWTVTLRYLDGEHVGREVTRTLQVLPAIAL
ncbi:MAG TPA: hypothetical protein VFR97_15810 [Capillimicrobium sp.]|nr:hypothetical protein [Capillimicrobium sp.]